MREVHVPGTFDRLDQGSRARAANFETFRRAQMDLASQGLVVIPSEPSPRHLRIPRAVLPLAAVLELLALSACARPEEEPMIPIATPLPRATPTVDPTLFGVVELDAAKVPGAPGLRVSPGDSLRFEAQGSWCSGGLKAPNTASCGGPEGIRPPGPGESNLEVPNAQIGALVGRIGGETFPIGKVGWHVVDTEGEIELFMNDVKGAYTDNRGSVRVEIFRQQAGSAPQFKETPRPVQPTPTETPKPVEKGIIGDLRLIPVSVEEYSYDRTREGYKGLKFIFAVQNRGFQLKDSREIEGEGEISFRISAAGGFFYPEKESVKGDFMNYGAYNDFKIPPEFQFPMTVSLEVPITAKEPKLVATSKSSPQTPTIWDVATEFPPPGQARKVEYYPKDGKGLKKLGESLEQKFLKVTPLEIELRRDCPRVMYFGDGNWILDVRWQVENTYGYDLQNMVVFRVFDSDGRVWSPYPGASGIDIPPGVTQARAVGIDVSHGVPDYVTGPVCKPGEKAPPQPSNLRLLMWLPRLEKIQAPETYAVYDLGNDIPVAPNR